MKPCVVIAGGGTGGHIYPGLSIAEQLKKLGFRVVFVGAYGGLEEKIVPQSGFQLVLLPVGKLNRSGFKKLITLIQLPLSFLYALYWWLRLRPVFVLGVGGFAAGPFVLLSSMLGKTALWEPNAYPGMTNRLLSRWVDLGYLVFEDAAHHMKLKKTKILGLPVREDFEAKKTQPDAQGRLHILITGGSQGARAINQCVVDMLDTYRGHINNLHFYHQTGRLDYDNLKAKYKNLDLSCVEYSEFVDDMAEKFSWADLIICRAGASTVAELAAAAKPAIIIPLPTAADNHQYKNAEVLARAEAAILIEQKDLTPERLWEQIKQLGDNPEQVKKMSENVHRLHVAGASKTIAQDIASMI